MAGIIVPAASSTATTAINFRSRFVHGQRPPAGILAVQGGDGFFRFIVIRHFHETKAA